MRARAREELRVKPASLLIPLDRIMSKRFRGLHPSAAFLLVLVGLVLFLLSSEVGQSVIAPHGVAPGDWVRLTGPDAGSIFHSFEAGQRLGPLVARELPRHFELLTELCRAVPLDAGTEIRLASIPGSEALGCAVTPLSERCRYLLGMPLNVNRAGVEALELLPGIGPRLASRILEVRSSLGCFSSPEELLRVPGIGRKLLKKMRGRVCF